MGLVRWSGALAALAVAACAHDYRRSAPVETVEEYVEFLGAQAQAAPPPVRPADRDKGQERLPEPDESKAVQQAQVDPAVKGRIRRVQEEPGADAEIEAGLRVAESIARQEAARRAERPGEPQPSLADLVCDAEYQNRVLEFWNTFRVRAVPAPETDGEPPQRRIERERVALRNARKLAQAYASEWRAIRAAGRDRTVGLALSGGGIRSASFSGGVLQGLHELGLLERIGYLSTVSGGGYAGSWYMLQHRQPDGELFGLGSLHQQHLGQNGFFLSVGHYSKSATEVVGRALLTSLLVPVDWIGNGLLDLDVNTFGQRDDYRRGIGRSFHYAKPMWLEQRVEGTTDSIAKLLPGKGVRRPFWIVNAHLALNDDGAAFRARSGDAFEITPLRAGADAVGYVDVEDFAGTGRVRDAARFWMTPSYATAISGAAVDASSLRTSHGVNVLLKALNLDLGYYVHGWSRGFVRGDCDARLNVVLHHALSPWPLYELVEMQPLCGLLDLLGIENVPGFTGHDQRRNGKEYYLTDGGHFDNLGVYSLVKRGCRLIVVADATRDPGVSDWEELDSSGRAAAFSDLRLLESRLFADFGAELRMSWREFSPRVENAKGGFGPGAARAVFVGTIDNLPADCGCRHDRVTVVYVKAAYDHEDALRESFTFVDAEKARTPEFPNEATSNQFYSEEKVLSYRALGRALVVANAPLLQQVFEDVMRHDHRPHCPFVREAE